VLCGAHFVLLPVCSALVEREIFILKVNPNPNSNPPKTLNFNLGSLNLVGVKASGSTRYAWITLSS